MSINAWIYLVMVLSKVATCLADNSKQQLYDVFINKKCNSASHDSVIVASAVDCAVYCSSQMACLSVNVGPRTEQGHSCEALTVVTADETQLLQEIGWSYMRIEWFEPSVYHIRTQTGGVSENVYADSYGTDIFLTIFGQTTQCTETLLGRAFDEEAWNDFEISCGMPLYLMTGFHIRLAGDDGWYLRTIIFTYAGSTFEYSCGCWINDYQYRTFNF